MAVLRYAAAALAALALAACEGAAPPPLPGKRISVLSYERNVEPDPAVADVAVRLPRPFRNLAWPQAGGYPNKAMHHLEAAGDLRLQWRVSAGAGADDDRRILATPVIADGMIYTLDAEALLRAFDAGNGARYWQIDLAPPEKEGEAGFGGGLAVEEGVLFVATGFGEVAAFDAKSGAMLWRNRIGIPFRAAPLAVGGRVFVISVDNQTHALDAKDGKVQWTHNGISEDAGLLATSAPAFEAGLVIVPYSSGEIFALRPDSGRPAWGDSLAPRGRVNSVETLAAIAGKPVLDRGRVYAIGNGGQMVAMDLRSGTQIWDQQIGGIETPWIAGDYLFVLSNDGEIVCLRRTDGRIRWATPLARWLDPEKRQDIIVWMGPVLLSDRLIVVSSRGIALSISPYTGEPLGQITLPDGVAVAPVVANGAMYLLTQDAELLAFR